ncbi:hypothetical protein FRC02_002446 [Tulasnella sp. 418]|nr:hypothetical protein FRC02_002446 [Tulasnella sp. 418]
MSRSTTATIQATDTSVANSKLSLTVEPKYVEGNPSGINGDGFEMNVLGSTSHQRTRHKDSRSASANAGDPAPSVVSASTKRKDRLYLAVLSWSLFVVGWNDGTLGPLLPRIQDHYHVGFTVVSLLFISSCVSFIGGAIANVYLSDRLGFGKTIAGGAALQIAAYAILAPAPPFPVMCIAYGLCGFAMALQDAQSNAFIASIPRNASMNMGILHAVYGLGAFSSPLVATQFAQRPRWSFHFLVSLGISVINTVILVAVFKLKRQDHFIPEETASNATTEVISENKYKQIMSQKLVHYLAAFILVYVGTEVTIGGWIVTYLIEVRGGGPSSGYVSSGFFGGLTLGRVLLLWVNKKIGEKRVIYIYSVLAIALELVVWLVPNLIGNAVAVSIVGMLLGPFYPICMNVASSLLPQSILAGSIGWIAGFGQAGSAVFPFMTGAMASKHGVKVLQPLIVAMLGLQIVLWALVTRSRPTRAQ